MTEPASEPSVRTAGARPPSFEQVFEQHLDYVVHSLRRLGIAERDVEDLAHEVLLVVHKRLSSYDPARPIKPWLFGIAFRVASDFRRRARTRLEVPDSDPGGALGDGSHAEDAHALRDHLMRALDTLDDEQRALFVLHAIDGASAPEIAEAMGIELNTVYSRLRTARLRVREAYERRIGRGEA